MIQVYWSERLNDYAFWFPSMPIFMWGLDDAGERAFWRIVSDFELMGEF